MVLALIRVLLFIGGIEQNPGPVGGDEVEADETLFFEVFAYQ